MNNKDIESSIGLDRLATVNEVCCAMSVFSQGALEPVRVDHARNLPEDMMWLEIVDEMPTPLSN